MTSSASHPAHPWLAAMGEFPHATASGPMRPAPGERLCPACGRSHWRPDHAETCVSCELPARR